MATAARRPVLFHDQKSPLENHRDRGRAGGVRIWHHRLAGNWSRQGLVESIQNRIHLGLDLKGGTHLILQVQVNDAVRADAERVVERLKDEMKSKNIPYAEVSMPDPANQPDHILIKGVPPENAADLRSIVSERLPEYDSGLAGGQQLAGDDETGQPRRSQEALRRPGD